jgi:predicted DNA-binding transcriptional regulator AlpA
MAINSLPPKSLAPAVEALLISDITAAALAGVSRATWRRLFAAGKTPAAVRLGRRRLWDVAELRNWIQAKCPDRRTWEALQAQSRRYPRVVS